MALSRIKIGDIITVVDKKNTEDCDYPFYGININKEFMPSVANTSNVDRKKYKVIVTNRFVFSGMQTGRDNCIRIGIYTGESPVLVSPAYTTFEVTNPKVLPLYFFMIFNSKEMDRYGAFLSDSSVRSNLDWDRFCDIELEVPSIEIQKKYVAIYEGMLANLHSYEKGLDDLKLVCDGYIEDLRRKYPLKRIGAYLEEINERNDGKCSLFQGVDVNLVFTEPKRVADDTDSGKIVHYDEIAFNKVMKANCTKLPIALRKGPPCVVSGSYTVVKINDKNTLLPDYLMLWLSRSETQRWAGFVSYGTTRDIFPFESLCELKIPLPEVSKQKAVVEVFDQMKARKCYLDQLKGKISSICHILIRGSVLETQGGN